MGTRQFDRSKGKGRNRDVIDYNKILRGVLKDPQLCRHLLLAPRIAEERNGNNLSFIGYLKKLIMSREISMQRFHHSRLFGCLRMLLHASKD